MTETYIAPTQLKAMLHDGKEIAVLDAREERDFATSHLLLASSAPLGRLELVLGQLVPRRAARIVWTDSGGGEAARAARRSAALGYTDVSVLAGGIDAWRANGYALYTGVHVPSKAFAEVVEHHAGTPWISVNDLDRRLTDGETLTILDSRSFEEYHSNSIPTAISCPGAELAYRVHDLVEDPDSLVVVNCGGRTRSIIGAQALINAGISNRVVSLKDGTMAWHLAGFEVEHGQARTPPPVSESGRAKALAGAAKVAERFGVRRIDEAQLQAWRKETSRTLFLLDVRTPEEYRAGHMAGAICAPGGQLVQETDSFLGVWGARVILADDDGVRAVMTASWLLQMGWAETYVLELTSASKLEVGEPSSPVLGTEHLEGIETLSVRALEAELARGSDTVVVDIESSDQFRERHVPGAWYANRARLEAGAASLPPHQTLVLTSADGTLAMLCARSLTAEAGRSVQVLQGGTNAWAAAGLPVDSGMERAATPAVDVWHTPRERSPEEREAAMREYLTWEAALVYQIDNDDDSRFREFPT